MATLAENAAAVKAAQVAIDAAIVAKGGTTTGGLTNAAAAIAAIPSGSKIWDYPSDWPVDWIKSAYREKKDPAYDNYVILLIHNLPNIVITIRDSIAKVVLDNGEVITTSQTYTFDDDAKWHYAVVYARNGELPNYYYFPYVANAVKFVEWCYGEERSEFYPNMRGSAPTAVEVDKINNTDNSTEKICVDYVSANEIIRTSFAGLYSSAQPYAAKFFIADRATFTPSSTQLFYDLNNVRRISGIDTSGKTTFQLMFYRCRNLERVDFYNDTFDTSAVTGRGMDGWSIFSDCHCLEAVPAVMDFSKFYTVGNMFYMCRKLKAIPDIIDFTGVGDPTYGFTGGVFGGCLSLERLPTHFTCSNPAFSYTISFADSHLVAPDTLASFAGGVLTGGMVHNLNDVTNDGGYTRTITLPKTLRAKFTDDEVTAIIDAANAKGWTLGNFAL